jgi:hypothetical protein
VCLCSTQTKHGHPEPNPPNVLPLMFFRTAPTEAIKSQQALGRQMHPACLPHAPLRSPKRLRSPVTCFRISGQAAAARDFLESPPTSPAGVETSILPRDRRHRCGRILIPIRHICGRRWRTEHSKQTSSPGGIPKPRPKHKGDRYHFPRLLAGELVCDLDWNHFTASSAASSLALLTFLWSYQKRAGNLWVPMITCEDQAVRPPVSCVREGGSNFQCNRSEKDNGEG